MEGHFWGVCGGHITAYGHGGGHGKDECGHEGGENGHRGNACGHGGLITQHEGGVPGQGGCE